MFLSKEDSTQLWESVKQHNFSLFNPINQKLLNPQGSTLRHLPVRLYLPHKVEQDIKAKLSEEGEEPTKEETQSALGSLRVVQSLIAPSISSRKSSI